MTVISIVIGALSTVTKGIVKIFEDLEMSGNNPKHSITEIGQNTGKCPGDLRRLVVTQTPVKGHQR